MLAISPLRSSDGNEREGDTLFEDIDFDDLFVGFDDGDILPDLEIDPAEIFAEFSFSGGEESGNTVTAVDSVGGDQEKVSPENETREDKDLSNGEVISAKTNEDGSVASAAEKSASPEGVRGRKLAASGKSSHGKKKVKVDWTPELHRRFVQAVEQLGVDKAVPSRILELMGIDCLTRHNIASHLQKYRSHRKHLLAREAEAASWSQRRQMYTGGVTKKPEMRPNWVAPTIIGFPPPIQPFRPLHVWGHPTVDHPPLVPVWPRHLSPPPCWAPPRPPVAPPPDPSFWHTHYQRALTHGTPCFPSQLLPTTRFPAPPVPGIPPHPLYTPLHNAVPPSTKHSGSQLQLDAHPSNESIDAAIGDVLAKPWSPLPLGLKPPSLESVMVELQRQGVSKVPTMCV